MTSRAQRIVDDLSTRMGTRVSTDRGPRPNDRTITVKPDSLLDVVRALKREHHMALATTVATDERDTPDGDVKMFYVFEPAPLEGRLEDTFITLRVPLDPADPRLPAITPMVPAAAWHEREAKDLMGIIPVGHPDPRPLVLHDGWPKELFPLRKDYTNAEQPPRVEDVEFPHLVVEGEGVVEVPVGPIHAGIIEPGHFRISCIGDIVLHFEARLFYCHRGMEKRCEGRTAQDAFSIAERICGVCAFSHGLGFCEAAEQLAEMEIPARARVIRTIGLELERLYNHVGDVGNICAGAAFHLGNAHGNRLREHLLQLNETVTGHRYLRGLVTPGGVRQDLDPDLIRQIRNKIDFIATELDELDDSLHRSTSLLDRLDTTGVVTRQAALDLCATGVAARAVGISVDARRDHPHAAYATDGSLPLEVPTQTAGDSHARLSQRVEEARVSMRILRQLLDSIPTGPLAVAFPRHLPASRVAISAIETPRGQAIHWLRADAKGLVDRYRLRSPSYVNWPIIPFSLAGVIVPDFPIVNKSYELCYSCCDR